MLRVWRVLAALSLVVSVLTAVARDAWSQPALEPPRVDTISDIPYPEGGTGDAAVDLFLVINPDGTVRSAQVDSGEEPFASAAREGVMTWRFLPARRAGEPVAAKIRYRVTFVEELVTEPLPPEEPPLPPVPGGAPPLPTPEPAPTAAPAPAPALDPSPPEIGPLDPVAPGMVEVTVGGMRHPPSVTSLRRAEVRQLPGAFGDPFRAIEVMPGVTPIVSGLPFFYVRGAPPGNVGYFLDGVRVPYLFHAAAGPSVVHPGIVDRVDLYAGGYPAQFGRFAGAIVSAETTEPRPEWHGEANLRIVDAGALVEGGFADGRGTALVAGRYSYTAGLFSLLSPEITLDYRDYQARATFDLTDRDRLTLFAFGSYDFLSSTENDIETVLFGSEFYRVDGRYDVRLRGGGNLRAAVTWGFDQTRVADGRNTHSQLVNTRVRLVRPLSRHFTLRGGFDMQLDNYGADPRPYTDPDDPGTVAFNALFPPRHDTATAGWMDVVYRPTERFELTAGIRVDTYYSNGAKALAADPRLMASVDVHPRIRLLHALGVANQPPSFVVPVPGLAVASLQGGLQTSLQAASGAELKLPWDLTVTATAFTSVFLNMSDTIGVLRQGDEINTIPRSQGGAKGFELLARRSLTKRLGGLVAYTFSRTTRSIDGFTIPAGFDRTHVLNATAGYDLGGGYHLGGRLTLYTGAPNPNIPVGALPTFRPSDPPRDPAFYRIDFRFEKRWQLPGTFWISGVIEMLNATFNTERIRGQEIGPVSIPSFGLEGGF